MKERKIILVLTALFGLAMALRAGYEEIIRSGEPAPRRPLRRAVVDPGSQGRDESLQPLAQDLQACTAPDCWALSLVELTADPADNLRGHVHLAPGQTLFDDGTCDPNEDYGAIPFKQVFLNGVPYAPGVAPAGNADEPSSPPPVNPDGDRAPDPAPGAPGGAPDQPPPSPPPAGPEAGKDPNVLTLLGGGRLKIKERRLEIDGVLCKRDAKVALELLACAPAARNMRACSS